MDWFAVYSLHDISSECDVPVCCNLESLMNYCKKTWIFYLKNPNMVGFFGGFPGFGVSLHF